MPDEIDYPTESALAAMLDRLQPEWRLKDRPQHIARAAAGAVEVLKQAPGVRHREVLPGAALGVRPAKGVERLIEHAWVFEVPGGVSVGVAESFVIDREEAHPLSRLLNWDREAMQLVGDPVQQIVERVLDLLFGEDVLVLGPPD